MIQVAKSRNKTEAFSHDLTKRKSIRIMKNYMPGYIFDSTDITGIFDTNFNTD